MLRAAWFAGNRIGYDARVPDKPRPWWKEAPAPTPAPVTVPVDGPRASNDLADGESREVQGSGAKPYTIKNTAGVYSCTCPAWMHLGVAIERRTCKHLKALRGAEAEQLRVGEPAARAPATAASAAAVDGVAPPLLLAHKWEHDVDLTGWWMSEKLDGVRAFWDGTKLVSRLGNTFFAPDWFLEGLPPDMPLDGELFGGRKKFQRTVSIVRRQDRDTAAWREISYLVFDAPKHGGTFEERLAAFANYRGSRAGSLEHVLAHPHEPCRGLEHLREELARVESLGGEGLMMRKPGSRYEVGRSHTLLKVKTFHDAEAVVVAHLPGAGKHKGRLGALECDLADGTRFSVGTGLSDAERTSPPPIGAIITFRYQELSNDGVPRFPSYVGMRDDVRFERRPVPAVPAAPSVATPTTTSRDARVFVKDGATWQITLDGKAHTIRRVRGEAIETLSTSFGGGAAAWRDADRKIATQIAEGWIEVPDDD